MNIALTCAGRRHYLVNYFRQALRGKGQVVAIDASPDAPALRAADRVVLAPAVADPGYVEFLLEACRSHEVGLLLSLNDFELPILAAAREKFVAAGTIPVVSRSDVVDVCFDKWKTYQFLKRHGIGAPRTWLNARDAKLAVASREVAFPLIVKPRWGTASMLIETVENESELDLALELGQMRLQRSALAPVSRAAPHEAMLIQERLNGQEFSLDLVNNLREQPVAVFVKRKLRMRAGETDGAEVVQDTELSRVAKGVAQNLRHVGMLDCDAFRTEHGVFILELNPRFGGGYPFSHEAGANVPAALIAWASGEEADPSWFQPSPGWAGSKCDIVVATHAERSAENGAARRVA
jgi:carbamoyl-phosphate synthase large subunit